MGKVMKVCVAAAVCVLCSTAMAGPSTGLSSASLGGVLPNTADYSWWYGCSPTSAGMMMGYYDRNGYGSWTYNNLVPGGVAEAETYVGPPTGWGSLANNIIASAGHVADFYVGPYLASGDDVPPPHHSFDSLADFMGTSQDSVGNSNGSTTFWYLTDGTALTAADTVTYGVWNSDGMYGVGEYVSYAGYGYTSLYTQLTNNDGFGYPGTDVETNGFSYSQYMAEIDAGRPVMIHVEGHSMAGIGYDENGSNIVLYDTWSAGPWTMPWGGYYSGRYLWGVTALELGSGDYVIPAPGAILLGGIGTGLVTWLRRRRTL